MSFEVCVEFVWSSALRMIVTPYCTHQTGTAVRYLPLKMSCDFVLLTSLVGSVWSKCRLENWSSYLIYQKQPCWDSLL